MQLAFRTETEVGMEDCRGLNGTSKGDEVGQGGERETREGKGGRETREGD